MGLAVYNSIILDIHFPPVCYRKLLSPAVVPYNNPRATVGVTPVTLRDLEQTLPVSITAFNLIKKHFVKYKIIHILITYINNILVIIYKMYIAPPIIPKRDCSKALHKYYKK